MLTPEVEQCIETVHHSHTKGIPSSEVGIPATHHCYAAVISPQPTGQVHSVQTGKFPVPSSNGHKYIMVAIELDGNYINAECMCMTVRDKSYVRLSAHMYNEIDQYENLIGITRLLA